eukprot:GHVS01102015.1.p1 GENE.GHVS01102015.1~~GHVS01102015.1.p1  ORF type:complete len:193 (-),score=34.14 GHVS01102015.1:746-1324(-)
MMLSNLLFVCLICLSCLVQPLLFSSTPNTTDTDSAREEAPQSQNGTSNTVVGATTVAGAVVGSMAPVIVTTAVNAVGFTASGIAAGSTAAGMMSSLAAASGGAVAAGTPVAILQSIGVIGLGAGTAVAVAAGGAIVGAAAVGGATYAGLKLFQWLHPTTVEKSYSSEVDGSRWWRRRLRGVRRPYGITTYTS